MIIPEKFSNREVLSAEFNLFKASKNLNEVIKETFNEKYDFINKSNKIFIFLFICFSTLISFIELLLRINFSKESVYTFKACFEIPSNFEYLYNNIKNNTCQFQDMLKCNC